MNQGGYRVCLQRWISAGHLSALKMQEYERLDRTPPAVGQKAYWKGGNMFHALVFRRDQYLVTIEFGPSSDSSRASRLAEIIDAKIQGKPIPEAAGTKD